MTTTLNTNGINRFQSESAKCLLLTEEVDTSLNRSGAGSDLCDCDDRRDIHSDRKYFCMAIRKGRPCNCDGFRSKTVTKKMEEARQGKPWNPIPPVKREPSPKPKEPEKVKPKEGIEKWL